MADATKKIIFEAQDNGVESKMDRLRAGAEDWLRSLVRGAREYSTSGQEVIKYLEEEIKLAERKDRLNNKIRQTELDTSYRGRIEGERNPMARDRMEKAYKASSAQISSESRADSIQVELLRELIETVKQSSREEIRSDRKTVEDTVGGAERVQRLGIGDQDELEALKETLQYEAIGGIRENEGNERRRFRGGVGRGVGSASNMAAGVGLQPNEFFMGAALVGMIPIVGNAISSVMGRLFQNAQQYETGRTSLAQITGTSNAAWTGAPNLAYLGRTPGETAQLRADMSRARGYLVNDQSAISASVLMAGTGVGESTIMQRLKLQRSNVGEGGLGVFGGQLAAQGIISKSNTTLLQEYFDVSNQLAQQQLGVLGRIDTGVNDTLLASIAGGSTMFQNPEVLASVAGGLDQGLRGSSGAMRAVQYQLMRRARPGMSVFQMQLEQEKGLGGLSGEMLPMLLEDLSNRYGGNQEMMARELSGMSGISLTKSYELVKNASDISSKSKVGGGEAWETIMAERSMGESIGAMATSTAKLDTWFAESGAKLVDGVTVTAEKVTELVGKVTDFFDGKTVGDIIGSQVAGMTAGRYIPLPGGGFHITAGIGANKYKD